MESGWDKAISFTGLSEGGANFDIVNGKPVLKPKNINDKGGPTIYGITAGTLASAKKAGIVSHADITRLTKAEADAIYKARYWTPYGFDALNWQTATCLFDACVNHGPGGMATLAQRTCNYFGANIAVDGAWGPKTSLAVQSCSREQEFCQVYLVRRKEYFESIVARNPRQKEFLKGWFNRLRNLAKYIRVASPV
jgi:lysozyme family protein